MKEWIMCSAIWYKDLPTQTYRAKNQDRGIIVCGHRHGHCIDVMSKLGKLRSVQFGPDSVGENEQGFLTNTNRFVSRDEAGEIAFAAGQVDRLIKNLHSEDLW